MTPLVSVVIPTYNRPVLVKRSVQSALDQTLQQIEVIVVIDGHNLERESADEFRLRAQKTRNSLADITDPRLRVIEKAVNESYTAARMTGIYAAEGKWIAHLDDDDEWMPQKLEKQVQVAENSRYQYPIVSCYVEVNFPESVEVLPRRLPKPNEHLSEYFFVRRSPFYGDALIQSSSIMMSRELILKAPYTSNIHGEWGWLLESVMHEGVGVEFVPEPLAKWNLDANRNSLSRSIEWKESLVWIRDYSKMVTPSAYAAFILTEVAARAAAAGAWQQLIPLLWEAMHRGRPRLQDVATYLGMWLIRPELRSWLRSQRLRKKSEIVASVRAS